MARQQTQQTSLITGIISPTLLGRTDLKKYYSGVAEAENVVISTHGGMTRRGGLKHLATVTTGSRLFSFEFSISQNYVFVLTTASLIVYFPNSGTPLATISWATTLTTTQLKDMDIIQSADTVIIVHEDFNPISVQRQGSDTNWAIANITLTNIPKFDFDSTKVPNYTNYGVSSTITVKIDQIVYNNDGNAVNGTDEFLYKAVTLRASIDLSTEDYSNATNWTSLGIRPDVWGDTGGALTDRGYIRTCTFHQGRLCFGGSKAKPTSVWCSVINDFFNFDTGGADVQPDDAIFDVLDTDQFNAVVNIISSRTLQVLTAGGEFTNNAGLLTPSTSAWIRDTGYGASRIKPVVLDGSTYFMDRFRKTVRGFIYDFNEGGYTTPPISILADSIITDVQDMDIVRGSSTSVSNLLYLVNGDGTVAVFNTMRKENIAGWTKWTTIGTFKRVAVTGDVVTFIVERDGTEYLEVLDTSLLLDHSFQATTTDRVTVDTLLQNSEIRIVADGVTQKNIATTGTVAIADRVGAVVYAGLNYTVKIKTLPISANTQAGNFVNQLRRVTKCIVTLYQSRGVYINNELVTSRKFGINNLDTTLALKTGTESVYLLGYNTDTSIEITQTNPEPMTVLALDLEISF